MKLFQLSFFVVLLIANSGVAYSKDPDVYICHGVNDHKNVLRDLGIFFKFPGKHSFEDLTPDPSPATGEGGTRSVTGEVFEMLFTREFEEDTDIACAEINGEVVLKK